MKHLPVVLGLAGLLAACATAPTPPAKPPAPLNLTKMTISRPTERQVVVAYELSDSTIGQFSAAIPDMVSPMQTCQEVVKSISRTATATGDQLTVTPGTLCYGATFQIRPVTHGAAAPETSDLNFMFGVHPPADSAKIDSDDFAVSFSYTRLDALNRFMIDSAAGVDLATTSETSITHVVHLPIGSVETLADTALVAQALAH